MKNRNLSTLSLVALFCPLLSCLSFADAEPQEKILASVARVHQPRKDIHDTVTLSMTIHAPSRFGGFSFIVVTESSDRAKIRARFPIGSLQTLELPAKTILELEAQDDAQVSVERSLDAGIKPSHISAIYVVPTVAISDLTGGPVAFNATKEEAGQPANGPDSKPEGIEKPKPESERRSQ
jgi:hypothetical protein